MRAFARFRTPNGRIADLGPGDLIGRLNSAALQLDDPRVSEAHALISMRRGELMLLSLRRMFAVRGKPVAELSLEAGTSIELAPGLSIEVLDVRGPRSVLAIEVAGLGRRVLTGIASLMGGTPPELRSRFEPDALLHVWWNGDGWKASPTPERGEARAQDVGPGTTLTLAGLSVSFIEVELVDAVTTKGDAIGLPLHVIAWYDSVEIRRGDDAPVLTIAGVGARILSELIALDGPVEWHVVAKEVWRDAADLAELRHRWDVSLTRLRARLKHAAVRADLVRSTGAGLVQLLRHPTDVFEDRS